MIPLIAVLTAFLSGSLLGIALADRRTRRRQDEERAAKVADALADTVLVDGVELPKPEDERWEMQEMKFRTVKLPSRCLVLGQVIVGGGETLGCTGAYVGGRPLNLLMTKSERAYAEAVWRVYKNRVARRSMQSQP